MGMTREIEAYIEQLRLLFPRGRAWPEARGPVWEQLLRSLAVELTRIDGRLADLLVESDPRTAAETLEDYERVLGLPDPCFGGGETIEERRKMVVALTLMQGGQSPEYFVALAALFGFDIEVEEVFAGMRPGISEFGDGEFAMDWSGFEIGSATFGDAAMFGEPAAPFGWWLYGTAIEARRWEFGTTRFGDVFLDFSNRILECLITRFQPAHTRVWIVLDATAAVAALEN